MQKRVESTRCQGAYLAVFQILTTLDKCGASSSVCMLCWATLMEATKAVNRPIRFAKRLFLQDRVDRLVHLICDPCYLTSCLGNSFPQRLAAEAFLKVITCIVAVWVDIPPAFAFCSQRTAMTQNRNKAVQRALSHRRCHE